MTMAAAAARADRLVLLAIVAMAAAASLLAAASPEAAASARSVTLRVGSRQVDMGQRTRRMLPPVNTPLLAWHHVCYIIR
jgi:hypothetical protein